MNSIRVRPWLSKELNSTVWQTPHSDCFLPFDFEPCQRNKGSILGLEQRENKNYQQWIITKQSHGKENIAGWENFHNFLSKITFVLILKFPLKRCCCWLSNSDTTRRPLLVNCIHFPWEREQLYHFFPCTLPSTVHKHSTTGSKSLFTYI